MKSTLVQGLMDAKYAAMVAVLVVASVADADTWYANAANYGRGGLDGRSAATGWGTLQDAHDNAGVGDTILVLPGEYDQGGQADSYSGNQVPNRLYVTKKLTFRSTTPKAAHIVGRHGANADGRGSGAVRCVCVTADGAGSVFEDFTIRDGATTCSSGGDPLNPYIHGDALAQMAVDYLRHGKRQGRRSVSLEYIPGVSF